MIGGVGGLVRPPKPLSLPEDCNGSERRPSCRIAASATAGTRDIIGPEVVHWQSSSRPSSDCLVMTIPAQRMPWAECHWRSAESVGLIMGSPPWCCSSSAGRVLPCRDRRSLAGTYTVIPVGVALLGVGVGACTGMELQIGTCYY